MKTMLLSVVAIAIVCSASSVALAEKPTKAEVLVILAKEEAGTIDPELKKLAALKRAPFNAFRSMTIHSKPKLNLTIGKDAFVNLPNGRKVMLTLIRVMPDGRYRVKVSINRPEEKDYLPLLQVVASPGDPFFVAGQSYKGGTLVVGFQIGDEVKKPEK